MRTRIALVLGVAICSLFTVGHATAQTSEPYAVVGQGGGVSYSVAMSDQWLVGSLGPRIAVLDASDPLGVRARGMSEPLEDLVRKIVLDGNYAYVAAEDAGLHVFDLSDPEQPQHIAGVALGGDARGIALKDDMAFVSAWGAGLTVFDISDPTDPREIGALTDLRGAQDVVLEGNTAYVSYLFEGVRTIDISDPTSPDPLSHFKAGDASADGLAVSESILWVAGGVDLVAVDVADPSAPRRLSRVPSEDRAWSVVASGSRVYLCDGKAGVRVFNVIDPSSPSELMRIDTPGDALNASAIGQRLAIADWLTGVWITDVTNPATPVDLGRWPVPGYAKAIAVAGDSAWVGQAASGLAGFDISDTTNPRATTLAETTGQEMGVAADLTRAFATEIESMQLWLYDVAPGGHLTQASTYPVRGRAATLDGDTLYIARGLDGIEAIDVSDTSNPVSLDRINTPGYALQTVVSDGYMYVADRHEGVRVIDVHTPTEMEEVGEFRPLSEEGSLDVAVVGDVLHVAAADGGLVLADVSSPASPAPLGQVKLPNAVGPAKTVAANDHWAFVGHPANGLQIVDVEDPSSPIITQYVPLPWAVDDIAIQRDQVHLAGGATGLVVLGPSGSADSTIQFLDVPAPVSRPTQALASGTGVPTITLADDLPDAAAATAISLAETAPTKSTAQVTDVLTATEGSDAPTAQSGEPSPSLDIVAMLGTHPIVPALLAVALVVVAAIVAVALRRRTG